MDNPQCQGGPSNSRSPYHSPLSGQTVGGGKAAANNFASSSMSGMSSRTSPLGNKTVAFSKPTNPGESSGAGSLTRMGPESTHRGGPRLQADGLMVPPASDAATLRRQVAALQIDLEAHIDGEQRLQSINQQLRERLEVYMKQNHENVERAETELNTLHEDMEQTLELQRRLAQRATALEKEKKEIETVLQRRVLEFENERTSLQTRIESMGEDLRAKAEAQEKVNKLQAELLSTLDVKAKLEERLETFAKETAFLKKKADDYSNELRDLILKEQLDQKMDRMGRKAVIRRAFINFQLGVREQCTDRANTVHARKLYRHHCCKKILFYLRMATQRSSVVRQALDLRCKNAFNACWRTWKLSMVAKRMGVNSLKKQDTARLFHSMHVWVAYIIRLRLNPERYLTAVLHWDRKCLQNYFERWLLTLRLWRLGAKEEKLLMGKAMRHFSKSLLRCCFESWQDWLKTYAGPKKKKFAEVQAHINMMTMKQATAAWRCIVYVKWVRRMKFEEAAELSKSLCIKRTFARLTFSAERVKAVVVHASTPDLVSRYSMATIGILVESSAVKSVGQLPFDILSTVVVHIELRWQQGLRTLKIDKLRSSQAIAFRATKTGRSVFRCWRNFLQYSMHMRIFKKMACRQYLHKLSVKSMQIWRENVNYKKAQQRATAEVNQALTRAAMVFWRDYHVYESIKKKKDHRAATHIKRKHTKLAKRILGLWWEQVAWKRKAMQLDNLLALRRRRTLLIQSLHVWLHATFDGLLIANAKFHEDLLEAQAQSEEQKHQVTTVDVENLQLIDRLHTMSSEVAYLKTTISEKEKQEEDLHRALEDGAMLESSMRGEIEQQHCRCEEFECEIQGLQKKLQMKNAEDTAGEIHHSLEIQNLEQALKELRIQLADKTSQIDSYEKALKETAERLEGASDESQEKLTSAFEIAGSLRKLLEDRESQFATLEGNCRRRELELGEVQRKLAVANCTLCETVECRDSRIQELETMLCCKQQEVQEVQQQLQNMELAMDSKESRVRKLEYEIKLMSEQTAMKTKAFVSSLNSWSATPLNHDMSASLRGCFSTKQSMLQTYEEAKNVLQQQSTSTSLEGAPTLLRRVRSYPYVTEAPSTTYYEDQQEEIPSRTDALPESLPGIADGFEPLPCQHDSTTPLEKPPDSVMGVSSRQLDEPAHMDMGTETRLQASEETLDQESRSILLYQGQDVSQPDWETSFALVSTTRPTPPGYAAEPGSYALTDHQEQQPLETGGDGVLQTTGEGPYRMILDDDPNAVDSLHLEIQRLQARIMSRLRDSAGPEDPSNRSGSRATPRPPPEAGPSSERTWDSR